MDCLKNKTQEELEKLQDVAVEITKLCAEYSQRVQKESHEALEPLWNHIQKLKNQLQERYIKYDEGVHCGAQSGGIRPSRFNVIFKKTKVVIRRQPGESLS